MTNVSLSNRNAGLNCGRRSRTTLYLLDYEPVHLLTTPGTRRTGRRSPPGPFFSLLGRKKPDSFDPVWTRGLATARLPREAGGGLAAAPERSGLPTRPSHSPALPLPVHVEAADGGAVPHVVASGAGRSICGDKTEDQRPPPGRPRVRRPPASRRLRLPGLLLERDGLKLARRRPWKCGFPMAAAAAAVDPKCQNGRQRLPEEPRRASGCRERDASPARVTSRRVTRRL